MMRFAFLRPSDVRLAPEHWAQYLTIRQVVKWEVKEHTGEYSGLVILGEQIVGTQGTPPTANMTIDLGEKEISAGKIDELCQVVRSAFFHPHIGVRVRFGSSTVQ